VISGDRLIISAIVYQEINEHREEILKKSGLSDEDLDVLISIISKYLTIFPTEKIIEYQKEAELIIEHIDKDDVLIVATSLANNNCSIWSDDGHFQEQDKIRIIKTKEMIERFSSS